MSATLRASKKLFAITAFCLLSSCGFAQSTAVSEHSLQTFGPPPATPTGALTAQAKAALDTAFVKVFETGQWGPAQRAALTEIAKTNDPRLAWITADLLRFATSNSLNDVLTKTSADLLDVEQAKVGDWAKVTDHLIAWKIPAPPEYLSYKRSIFTNMVPGWDKIFVEGDIDWRHVSWGGVLIDDRAYDTTDEPCNCIPAADNPEVTIASQANWLNEDDIVFGIKINGEARAYPRQIMEVREMVNDTLGGRDLGIPYCTLCGAAQAYFTDRLPGGVKRPILRTSGLLIRSNKVMYDVETFSVFDTFLGTAVTGPLAKRGIKLQQAPVITTTWAQWQAEYPETTVLAESLAMGRVFDFRNTRDKDGPIFPVGDVDPRLPVHEDIVGVVNDQGKPIAFQRTKAMAALLNGQTVQVDGIQLTLDAGGIKAVGQDGSDRGSHQAFWFAWSQFHPKTVLWKG